MVGTRYAEYVEGDSSRPEIGSPYVGPRDRYVVSLVVGYDSEDFADSKFPDTPLGALAAAIELTTDQGSPDTIWHVFDRETGEMHEFEQDDASDIRGEEAP